MDGYPLDLLTAGVGPLSVWVIARQHPGESMAEVRFTHLFSISLSISRGSVFANNVRV